MITAINESDQELLVGIKNADSTTIKRVYDLALPTVIRWTKDNNGSEADARDLFQDAIMALYRRLESSDFELTCRLQSYLRIMCRNLWLARLRKEQNKTMITEETEAVELDDNVLALIEVNDRHRLFRRHFDLLEDGCRRVLALFFDKTPLKAIAEMLGTSEGYIKKKKFKCKERLIKSVQSDPSFDELKY